MKGLFVALWLLAAAVPGGAAEKPANFVAHAEPRPTADVRFADADGRERSLAEHKSKVVLLNLWATWCVPCRTEMPALDRLQVALGGPAFEVVAISLDRSGSERVRRFYGETGLKQIGIHLDPSGKALRDLNAFGLPTTLLLDAEGREVGRLTGPAEWDAPKMVAFLRDRIRIHAGRPSPNVTGRPASPNSGVSAR